MFVYFFYLKYLIKIKFLNMNIYKKKIITTKTKEWLNYNNIVF